MEGKTKNKKNNYWINKHPFFKENSLEDVMDVIKDYQSPAYLYSKEVIDRQYNLLKNNLPENVNIFYAQKSNPNSQILSHLFRLGAGCDTASYGEMKSAKKAGFPPGKIMMTGPAKTQTEIEYAVNNGILSLNVESFGELHLAQEIASKSGVKQNIMVRINPSFEAGETNRIIGGAGISKFGIDIDQVPKFIEEANKSKNILLKGIHIFNSSQILNWEKIFSNTKDVIDTAIELSNNFDIDISEIDLGGGFGIPYAENEDELDVVRLGAELKELFASGEYKDFLKNVKLIFEPGRFLSGMSGIYVTKVLYTKTSCGHPIVLVDGGIHHLIRPALIGQPHPIVNLTAVLEGRTGIQPYMVAGPLCTFLDQFDKNAVMEETKPGDILAVLNAGAYGYTESMPWFLSHQPAKEIFI